MNNFYLNNDPLIPRPPQMNYYIPDPNSQVVQDWVGELDKQMKDLDDATVTMLNKNTQFIDLQSTLQNTIQVELMNLVKYKLNSQPSIVDSIKKQLDIIKQTKTQSREEERKSMSEINDYIKNYSSLTFDEYRKIKHGNNED